MINWLNRHQNATQRLFDIYPRLLELANAFECVGNDSVANELRYIANTVEWARSEASGAISEMLSDDVQRGQEQIGEVFMALLNTLPKEVKP